MKILLISEFFPATTKGDFTGGVEARTFFIARALAKRHIVTVLCAYTPGSKRFDVFDGFTVVRVGPMRRYTTGFDPMRLLYGIAAITTGITVDADIVEGTNFINHTIAYAIGRLKRIPIIFWTPDVWKGQWVCNMGRVGAIAGSLIERFNLSRRDVYFIAISKTVARKIIDASIAHRWIKTIYCGVDYHMIRSISEGKKRPFSIITVSRLTQYKNLDQLMWAFSYIVKTIPKATLRIIGQGDQEKRLKELAQNLNLEKKVQFLGFMPSYKAVLAEMKTSTVFCLPSTTEGFSIATVEALACGIPAIIADTPVNREITGGKGVLFFTSGNYKDLAEKIVFLLTHPLQYQRLKKRTKRVAKAYDWKQIAQQTEQFYQSLYTH